MHSDFRVGRESAPLIPMLLRGQLCFMYTNGSSDAWRRVFVRGQLEAFWGSTGGFEGRTG